MGSYTLGSVLCIVALATVLHSTNAASVVFDRASNQKSSKIKPPIAVTLPAKGVWYKCGFPSWYDVRYRVFSRPANPDYTVYIVGKSDVEKVYYKSDAQKRYPGSAKAKCHQQVECEKTAEAIYFNYYQRCLVIGSDSTTTDLTLTVSADSEMNVRVILVWVGLGLVGLFVLLTILNCIWGGLKSCLGLGRKKHNYANV